MGLGFGFGFWFGFWFGFGLANLVDSHSVVLSDRVELIDRAQPT